jgi:hypothetical protein
MGRTRASFGVQLVSGITAPERQSACVGVDRREWRKRYDEAFAAVRDIVNEADPESLLKLGAPLDEYEPEVAQLVGLVLRADALSEVEVVEVWQRWFGEGHHLRGAAATALTDDLLRLHGRYADA